MIDLRSDTVTQPTAEMRKAIAEAPVGDDVIDVDPSIDALEIATATLLGKERAIFMPSGTMTNQVAIRLHCKPGDEFLCEAGCHIFNYEQAAFAQLSGVAARPIAGDRGVLRPAQLTGMIRPENEHMVRTRLVTIENTHNMSGGRIQPYETLAEVCAWAHDHGLRTHLDGARLMNAVVASGVAARQWADLFDTVSICFSKGLGAPVGSALAGGQRDILEARRHRKVMGGGMRQAGIIAAGALHALQNHIPRLADDHAKAQLLASAVERTPGLTTDEVETNIVIIHVEDSAGATAQELVQRLRDHNVLVLAITPRIIRAVTHLGVSLEETNQACHAIEKVMHDNAA